MEKQKENKKSENNQINYQSKNYQLFFQKFGNWFLNKFLSENNPKDYTLSESSIFLIIKFNNSHIAYYLKKN